MMLNRILMAAAALTMLSASPALADRDYRDRGYHGDHYGKHYKKDARRYEKAYREGRRDERRYDRYEDRHIARHAYNQGRHDSRFYGGGRYYDHYRPVRYYNDRDYRGNWYGHDNRRYSSYDSCRKSGSSIEGTIIGGIIGGVLGNEVAGRRDKTVGTIIGAAAGAVIGHEIDDGGKKRRYCY